MSCQVPLYASFLLFNTLPRRRSIIPIFPELPHLNTTSTTMSSLGFLDVAKPFTPLLPETGSPETKIPFQQKLAWTGITLLVFLGTVSTLPKEQNADGVFKVMSQMPLYGIVSSDSSGPIYWLRTMMASNRGTLMEGVTPSITSGMVLQLLAGTHFLDIDMGSKSDRELYQTAQKLLAILLSLGQACVYVASGLYGSSSELGLGACVLLVTQLVIAGLTVM